MSPSIQQIIATFVLTLTYFASSPTIRPADPPREAGSRKKLDTQILNSKTGAEAGILARAFAAFRPMYHDLLMQVRTMKSAPERSQKDIQRLSAHAASLKPQIQALNIKLEKFIRDLKTTGQWTDDFDRMVVKAVKSSSASEAAKSAFLDFLKGVGGARAVLEGEVAGLNKLPTSMDNTVNMLAKATGPVGKPGPGTGRWYDFFHCLLLSADIAAEGAEGLHGGLDPARFSAKLEEFRQHCIPSGGRGCRSIPMCLPPLVDA
jgi:hypothetical protein